MIDNQRQVYDPKLDRLYMKTIKCPYCKAKIRSMQTTCGQCGLSKMQILGASNKKAKQMMRDGEHGKIVMLKKRPDDVRMSVLSAWLLLGFFGAHCLYVGRYIRGWIMFGLMVTFIMCVIIFPIGTWNEGAEYRDEEDDVETTEVIEEEEIGYVGMHPWREVCLDFYGSHLLPTDYLGLVAFVMWAVDAFGIVFGYFKYPVRLGESPNASRENEAEE